MRIKKPLPWTIGALVAFGALFHQLSRPTFSTPQCRAGYERLFAASVIRIAVVFGYKDARPARFVADGPERNYFVELLAEDGFDRDPADPELWTQSARGPDGKKHRVELRVVSSSVGEDDLDNRKNPFQRWQTRHAEQAFASGIRNADVVLYNGHSRTGGGPDFAPPRLATRGDGTHVDYDWYRLHEPGMRPLLAELRAKGTKVKILGLFSCASDQHFASAIHRAAPNLGLLADHALLYYADSLQQTRETISSLLKLKCQPDFRPAGIPIQNFF